MEEELTDKTLKCKDCGQEFIWSAKEQQFFRAKGFKNKPARCLECRKKNRQKVESEYFKVVCASCNLEGDVLFRPSDSQAKIYCKNCFKKEFSNWQTQS